jgi:hypothetical protein
MEQARIHVNANARKKLIWKNGYRNWDYQSMQLICYLLGGHKSKHHKSASKLSSAFGIGAGLPDGSFSFQNSNLGTIRRALELKMLVYLMTILNILLPYGIFYGNLVEFVVIWYIYPILVWLDQEKSGNTVLVHRHIGTELSGSLLVAILKRIPRSVCKLTSCTVR